MRFYSRTVDATVGVGEVVCYLSGGGDVVCYFSGGGEVVCERSFSILQKQPILASTQNRRADSSIKEKDSSFCFLMSFLF